MKDLELKEFKCEFKRNLTYIVKVKAVNHEHAKELVKGFHKSTLKDLAVVESDIAWFSGQVIREYPSYCGMFLHCVQKAFKGEFLKLPSFLSTRI